MTYWATCPFCDEQFHDETPAFAIGRLAIHIAEMSGDSKLHDWGDPDIAKVSDIRTKEREVMFHVNWLPVGR